MKRKVIQLAGKTLVVSIPTKWAKANNITKGDEIDVQEEHRTLILNSDGGSQWERIELDLSKATDRVVRWTLSALHKKGYDEMYIIFRSNTSIPRIVDDLVKNLYIGFAVIEQTESSITIKRITEELADQFPVTLRRAFSVSLSLAESTLDLIRKQRYSEIKDLINLEKTNNQLTNFCERILNKGTKSSHANPHFLYVVAWNLEKVADDYKYICEIMSETEEDVIISDETLCIFEETIAYLRSIYELYYSFDIGTLEKKDRERKDMIARTKDLLTRTSGLDTVVLSYVLGNIYKIMDFNASIIALHTQP